MSDNPVSLPTARGRKAYCGICSVEWPEEHRDLNNEQRCPGCGAGKLNREAISGK